MQHPSRRLAPGAGTARPPPLGRQGAAPGDQRAPPHSPPPSPSGPRADEGRPKRRRPRTPPEEAAAPGVRGHRGRGKRPHALPAAGGWRTGGTQDGANGAAPSEAGPGKMGARTRAGGSPPPLPPLCRPKFQPPQSEGAGRGLVPLGDQETGEQTFCCPHPPQQKWGRTESSPSTPPPPRMPSHPHCRPSHGDPGPSGSGRRATSMLGSGTRMVTQQVVLLSHTSEQVDPSTTLPPPPPACAPDGRGARSRRPQGLKIGGCEGLTA